MNFIFASVFSYTVLQALLSTTISIVLALPLAHFLYRFDMMGKKYFLALLPLLCIMPCKLAALGTLLSFNLTGLPGILLAHCALNIPFALYLLLATYNTFDSTWEKSAQQLGASNWQTYKTIYLPFLKPTIQSSAIIIFLLCFSSFSIPLLLGTHEYHLTPDIKISQLYTTDNAWTATLYFLMRLAIIMPLCITYMNTTARWANTWRDSQQRTTETYNPWLHGYHWLLYCVAPLIIILTPFTALLYAIYKENVFSFFKKIIVGNNDLLLNVPIHTPIINSILLGAVSGIGSVILGFIFYKLLYVIQHAHVKKALAIVISFSFIIGSVGCGIIASWFIRSSIFSAFTIAAACHMLLNFPFAYRVIKTQMIGWQPEWELLASNFGATRAYRLKTLDWPFLRSSLYQAFCITFGLSLTEVGAGSIFGNTTGITIPMAIHMYREHNFMPGVMGLSLLLLLCVFLLAYAINRCVAEA